MFRDRGIGGKTAKKNTEMLTSKVRMVVSSRGGKGFDLGGAQRVSGVLTMPHLLTWVST